MLGNVRSLYLRGLSQGVFRPGIDPLDLHWQISALCFFSVSNRPTFSSLFGRDPADHDASRAPTQERARHGRALCRPLKAFDPAEPRSPAAVRPHPRRHRPTRGLRSAAPDTPTLVFPSVPPTVLSCRFCGVTPIHTMCGGIVDTAETNARHSRRPSRHPLRGPRADRPERPLWLQVTLSQLKRASFQLASPAFLAARLRQSKSRSDSEVA